MEKQNLPIGYYLKKVDQLLTAGINAILTEFDISRTHWQILNCISESANSSQQEIRQLLEPFADPSSLDDCISQLIKRGLVVAGVQLSLTGRGETVYQSSLQKQKAFREKVMKNVSKQEYLQIITTLEKIIENLEK